MKVRFLLLPLFLLGLTLPLVAQDEDVPPDYDGLLVRNDITITMRGGDLEITVTVMDDRITRYATKEIRDYLNKLIEDRLAGNRNYDPQDPKHPLPFLVNFRALGQEVRYEPQELVIYNYGQKYKAIDVIPISPKFNDRVAYIRQPPVSAIYLFDRNIDLNAKDLTISYFGSLEFSNWIRIIEKVNEAKANFQVFKARTKK
jgi:hypothetical protein